MVAPKPGMGWRLGEDGAHSEHAAGHAKRSAGHHRLQLSSQLPGTMVTDVQGSPDHAGQGALAMLCGACGGGLARTHPSRCRCRSSGLCVCACSCCGFCWVEPKACWAWLQAHPGSVLLLARPTGAQSRWQCVLLRSRAAGRHDAAPLQHQLLPGDDRLLWPSLQAAVAARDERAALLGAWASRQGITGQAGRHCHSWLLSRHPE